MLLVIKGGREEMLQDISEPEQEHFGTIDRMVFGTWCWCWYSYSCSF